MEAGLLVTRVSIHQKYGPFFEDVTLAVKERRAILVSVAFKEIPIQEVNMS